MLPTSVSYRLISSDMQRSLNQVADQPLPSREIAYFKENIASIKSISDFIANDRVFTFAMKAHGLSDMSYAKGMMRKLLQEGVDDPQALAIQLSDPRFRDFARDFNFKLHGELTTSLSRVRDGIVEKYIRQTLEEDAGRTNEGVRLALYFERKAPDINTGLDILSDPALLKVAQIALNIPEATATQSIEKQAALISERLDFDELKTTEGLQRFMNRFTSLWELSNPQQAATAPTVLPLGSTIQAIGSNLLASLQNLRLGGR